jgi:hypothetical protein
MKGIDAYSGARFNDIDIDALIYPGYTELTGLMSQRIDSMLSKTLPSSRRLTIFRSVAELKDLPRSLFSLKSSLQDFIQSLHHLPKSVVELIFSAGSSKHIPAEYLSYWFGWRQLYNDVIGMLIRPKTIGKEVNYLLERRGKPTTFRSRDKVAGTVTTTPSWVYDAPNTSLSLLETLQSFDPTTTRHEKHHEFRLVINATFDFPHIGVPLLKEKLFLEKLGTSPSATDLYNLVPWTWLLDWFSGLGNYIELIDTINRAEDLYNWGLLTGITYGSVKTVRRSYTDDTHATSGPGWSANIVKRNNFVHTSILDYKLQARKDVVSAYGVKSTLATSTLSAYQASIIGAIIMSYR